MGRTVVIMAVHDSGNVVTFFGGGRRLKRYVPGWQSEQRLCSAVNGAADGRVIAWPNGWTWWRDEVGKR